MPENEVASSLGLKGTETKDFFLSLKIFLMFIVIVLFSKTINELSVY